MKKKITILLLLFVFSFSNTVAQTYIKTNALYLAALIPNIGVETNINKHLTFNSEFQISFWENIKGKPFKGYQFSEELRYYTKESFKGFYMAFNAGFDSFTLSKYGYPANKIQKGIGVTLGVSLGYQISIADRWNMDFYLGGGWHHAWYHGFDKNTNELYVGWNKSAEWIPYRAGVTFAYRLNK